MDEWSVLFPWCKYLRGRLQLEAVDPKDASRVRRLLLLLPKYQRSVSSELIPKLREALTLLSYVAKASPVILGELLCNKCGVDCNAADLSEVRIIFVLDDHISRSLLWPETLCKTLLALDGAAVSEEFTLAKVAVEKIVKTKLGTIPDVEIPFCIHFAPRDVNLVGLQQHLQSVERVTEQVLQLYGAESQQSQVEKTSNQDDDEVSKVWPFVFEAIQLNLREFELTEPVARTLQEIVLLGGKVSCLQLPLKATDFLSHSECPRQPLADCLIAVCGGGSALKLFTSTSELELDQVDSLAPQSNVETVVINDVDIDDRRFVALCSALRGATGVKELILESVFVQDARYARELKWKWLAYALFTPNGGHSSVKKLIINEPQLIADDVAAIASVVNARKPARELLDPLWAEHEAHQRQSQTVSNKVENQTEWSEGDDMVRLKQNTVVYLEPLCTEDEWLQNSIVLEQDASFAVMNSDKDDPEWVEILVPGYGKCWVHPEVAQDRYVDDFVPEEWQGLSDLAIVTQVTKSSSDKMLTQLFQLVGCDLVSLVLHTNWLREHCLGSILRSCPNLLQLQLVGAQVDDMFAFTHGYDVGYCQLESLSLEHFHVSAASLCDFAKVLADPEREAARHLRELSIGRLRSQDIDDAPTDYEEMIEAFLHMLASNTKLEYLKLNIEGDFYSRFERKFSRHDGELLSPIGMGTVSKLAFLSVFASKKQASRRIGDQVAQQVFNYAATGVARKVCFVEH